MKKFLFFLGLGAHAEASSSYGANRVFAARGPTGLSIFCACRRNSFCADTLIRHRVYTYLQDEALEMSEMVDGEEAAKLTGKALKSRAKG